VPEKARLVWAEENRSIRARDQLGPDEWQCLSAGRSRIHRHAYRKTLLVIWHRLPTRCRSWTIWSGLRKITRDEIDGSSMDSKCRNSFVRHKECELPPYDLAPAISPFSITCPGRRSKRQTPGTTGHVVPPWRTGRDSQRPDILAIAVSDARKYKLLGQGAQRDDPCG